MKWVNVLSEMASLLQVPPHPAFGHALPKGEGLGVKGQPPRSRIHAKLIMSSCLVALPLAAEPVSFNKDIAPLIFQNCSPCHRAGEAAPFSLLSYEDVVKHETQIVTVTQRRYMPPWVPLPGYGEFQGERRLTQAQLDLIAAWVKSGSPRGAAADLPSQPRFTEGWQLGQPDLVVRMPVPYRLAAGGSDVFRSFVLPVDSSSSRYV